MFLPQVNLILSGLGKLPFEQVESLYMGIRNLALQSLQAAEEKARQEADSLVQDVEVK